MSQAASKEALKLKKLLSELFQLDDAASLDFGIYRILAQRRAEMEKFLDELVGGIPARLAEAAGGERAGLKAELDAYVRRRQSDGDDLDDIRGSKRYKELADKVAAAVDVRELARDVFRDLHAFFSRYWDEGDFMAVPRYDRNTYAIPYDGSEVAMHWANRDQYYVKSTLFFNDMTVRDPSWPGTLRFELAAAVTDRDNAKGADANKRRFSLALEDAPVREEGKNLVVRLRYGPWSEPEDAAAEGEDTDEASGDEAEGGDDTGAGKKARTLKQDKLDELTAIRILEQAPPAWRLALGRQIRREGDKKDQTEILRRLRRYTKGNTADFFIHKNLRKFLRRELDFFIKNEVFDLDNVYRADVATLDAKLKRVRALRELADDLIDWLHQIEDFQRRLLLKKKFVLRTDWAVTMDLVPEELWAEIASCRVQAARWEMLFPRAGGAEGPLFSGGRRQATGNLLVESSCLPPDLANRIFASLPPAAVQAPMGILIQGDNGQAMRLMSRTYQSSVGVVYLDPPYNTGKDGFIYKDSLPHSTWLAMFHDRICAIGSLATDRGVLFASLDDRERAAATVVLRADLGPDSDYGTIVWHNARDNNPTRVAVEHEYVLVHGLGVQVPETWKSRISDAKDHLIAMHLTLRGEGVDNGEIESQLREFLKQNAETIGELERYKFVDDGGIFAGSESVHNPHPGGYDYEILHPSTGRPMRKPAFGYRFTWDTMKRDFIDAGRLIYGADEHRIVKIKLYLSDYQDSLRSVIDLDGRLGAYAIREMFGATEKIFKNPKPPQLLQRLLSFDAFDGALILDPFAGSGTTGHAALNLNREDGGSRRFVLIEMGDHFDTVLVPRILKATYSKDWKDGNPVDRKGVSALYKIVRLESYDDTLENIALERPDDRQEALFGAGGATGVGKDYLLRYMLRMEAGRSLLDKDRFRTPFDYRIRALVTKRDEQGASWSVVEETPVDLVETFNYLLGLRVKTMQPLGRDGDMAKARYVEGVRRDSRGDWCIKVLVVWRDCSKVDDQSLDDLFTRAQFTEAGADGRRYIADFDEVYVNGDNRLPNQRLDGERWKVTLIEEEFHRLMFDVPEEE